MNSKDKRIKDFSKMETGLFVHFGLYSIQAQGEWYMHNKNIDAKEYKKLMADFDLDENCFEDVIGVAKIIGVKYIVLTTRHHDGFSLYDTRGLSDYDVMHTPTKRDLIKEFVDVCNKNNIKPFLYHTLIDWSDERFKNDFAAYLEYLKQSITTLCVNYGEIGGFWFDGTWYDDNIDWKLDEIFGIVRKYQPKAIISNNGGQEYPGQIINKEIDCIVYERGQEKDKNSDSNLAREICQTLNNHWGIHKTDFEYKTIEFLLEENRFCRDNNINYLINVGPDKHLKIREEEKNILKEFASLR